MLDPYRMVVINVLTVLTLGIITLFYCYVYPKKKIHLPVYLILLAALPCISIFRKGIYESGDFSHHIYRTMEFTQALSEGILIPSWAPTLNSGYGYPVFLFIYLVPSYLISFIHTLGFSYITSEKILLASAFISSGLLMYITLKKFIKNDLAAFSGAVVYLFSPYHLVDLHFRVALAETIAFTLVPAVFFFVLKLWENVRIHFILWLGFLLGVFFLTHPAQFIFYVGLLFFYLLYQHFFIKNNWPVLLAYSTSFIIGFFISSFAWLSRTELSQFTQGSTLSNIPVAYVSVTELLFSPWRLGFLFQGHYGELSFLMGYTQICILLLAIGIVFLSRKLRKELLFWVICAFFFIFLMLEYSKPLWSLLPPLQLMQFSYRLLHPLIFCLAVITAYLVMYFRQKKLLIILFISVTVGYTILNWGHRSMVLGIDDTAMRKNLMHATKEGEGMIEGNPIWWNKKDEFWITTPAKEPLQILSGSGNIKELSRSSTIHTYAVYARTPLTLLENTFYFPDWRIYINGNITRINYQTTDYPARMVFSAPQGLSYIEVIYKDIAVIAYAKMLSIITTCLILLYTISYSVFKVLHKIRHFIQTKQ